MLVLKESQKSCKSFAAPALWQIQQPDSLAHSGAGYANIRVCSSKNPYFSYQTIKTSCNKNQITRDYWRVISPPEIPIIKEIMALGHDAAVVTFEPLKSGTKIKLAVAYYLVTNIKTGQVSKSAPNNFSEIYIYDLNPLTSYTFQITAVSVDGTSAPSSITRMITTGAVPIVYVAPTTPPLAAPAFTLSNSSETRTVNTAATGFTILSTGGAIANFAISATPPGMSFSTSTGALTGTPTSVAVATAYTITATNASGSATRTFTLTVAYTVGQTGPGGGKIFYVAPTPFACGPTLATTCTYLEAAANTWNGGSADPSLTWSTNVNNNPTTTVPAPGAIQTAIGTGYQNSNAIVAQTGNVAASSAAVAARAYQGNSLTDWYLPSKDELNQMCKWLKGITGDALTTLTTVCPDGFALNSGSGATGFSNDYYWSSSEVNASTAWFQFLGNGNGYGFEKDGTLRVRPIRSF
jgi:hypothetical protein